MTSRRILSLHGYCLISQKIAILLCILQACTSVPSHDYATLSPPADLGEVVKTALADPLFTEGKWPSAKWWESFADPQLNTLIESALADSPVLHQAQVRVENATQLARKQRASLLPTLNLDYEELWEYFSKNGFVRDFYPITSTSPAVPPTTNQIDLTLNFSYEFDFWGKNRKKLQAALGAVQTLAAEKAQSTLVLTTQIAQTYFQLQSHLAQKEILLQTLEDRSQMTLLYHARTKAGMDPLFPSLQSEKQVFLVKQLIALMDKEISLDRHLIALLIGQGPMAANSLILSSPLFIDLPKATSLNGFGISEPFPLPTQLSIDLLIRRPDIQAQVWRIESASKEIGVAKTEFYPNVNLYAFAGLESLRFSDFLDWSSHFGTIEPALHLPLFTGGRLHANLRSKVAEYNAMVFAYNEQLLHAAQEVADQIISIQKTNQELSFQIKALQIALDQYRLEQSCFRNGLRNKLEVLQYEEEVLNQRLTWVQKQKDYTFALLLLIKALGGGYA